MRIASAPSGTINIDGKVVTALDHPELVADRDPPVTIRAYRHPPLADLSAVRSSRRMPMVLAHSPPGSRVTVSIPDRDMGPPIRYRYPRVRRFAGYRSPAVIPATKVEDRRRRSPGTAGRRSRAASLAVVSDLCTSIMDFPLRML